MQILAKRGIHALTPVAIFVMALAGISAYLSTAQLINERPARAALRTRLAQSGALISALRDAEASQRGFVISGDEAFLDPFRAALPVIEDLLRQLEGAPEEEISREAFLRLTEDILDKVAFMNRTVDVRRREGFNAAVELVRSGEGKATMDEIRSEVAVIERRYSAALAERERRFTRQSQWTTAIVAFSSVLAVFLVTAAGVLTARDTARKRVLEDALAREHERLVGTIRAVPYGLVLFDREHNIILRNRAAGELLQLDAPQLSDAEHRKAIRLFRPDGGEIHPDDWPTRRAADGVVYPKEEFLIRRQDGTTLRVLLSAAAIRSADGELLGAVAGFQDITPSSP